METLGEALPQEIARCRELMGEYRMIGPPGQFAVAMFENLLRRADTAMIEGDLPAMLAVYHELKKCE